MLKRELLWRLSFLISGPDKFSPLAIGVGGGASRGGVVFVVAAAVVVFIVSLLFVCKSRRTHKEWH